MKARRPSVDEYRCTGRSTHQMQEAPPGAVFVCAFHHQLRYFRRLAKYRGRPDLRIVSIHEMVSSEAPAGYQSPIVVDHAALALLRPEMLARIHIHNCTQVPA